MVTDVSAYPDEGSIDVIVLGATPVNASPLVSTAAQKLGDEHDTEVRLASSFGILVGVLVLQDVPDVPPSHDEALPWLSTTTQKLEVGQEMDVNAPISCDSTGADQDPFTQAKKFPCESMVAQKEVDTQETEVRP